MTSSLDWLEEADSRDIYNANKYITNAPTDYSNARIPVLQSSVPDGSKVLASENSEKGKALVKTFFPPLPINPCTPASAYPKPLKARGIFSRNNICKTAWKLKPFKALGVDGIQNIVIQKCIKMILDHLYFLFRPILEFGIYPAWWLTILTIVLHKPGKLAYNMPKAYHPIGLLETIGKLFSTLVTADISFLTEKHELSPPTQFGGRAGRCATDTMHLITSKVKDTWHVGTVASTLFLDIQATFPNTVKSHLIHNLKSCHIPTQYVCLIDSNSDLTISLQTQSTSPMAPCRAAPCR